MAETTEAPFLIGRRMHALNLSIHGVKIKIRFSITPLPFLIRVYPIPHVNAQWIIMKC
ncbi:MAG: hypothetical protein PHF70_05375 [Opitutales bacterium]|nr:hypothetical protein [Opitutales bacterium]